MKTKMIVLIGCFLFSTVGYTIPTINHFDSSIKILPNSTLIVQEKINITTDGRSIKHGIFRDFPIKYKTSAGQDVGIVFHVTSTEINNVTVPYHTQLLANGIRVYIGSYNRILPAATYTFTLGYTVSDELGFFQDHDELYWNVTGNGWPYPINEAKIAVQLPGDAIHYLKGYTAYTGPQGSREKNYQASVMDDEVIFQTTKSLDSHEGFTIVLGWSKGFVTPLPFLEKIYSTTPLILLSGLVFLLIYYGIVWFRYGRDPVGRVVVPIYEPPAGFTPSALRYILKMGFDEKVLTADIINLAVKGCLSIKESKESIKYTLIKQPNFNEELSSEEQILVNYLFKNSDEAILKNSPELISMLGLYCKELKRKYENKYFIINTKYFLIGIFISMIPFGLFMALYQDDFVTKGQWIFYFILIWLFFACNLLFRYLLRRPTALAQELIYTIKGFKLFLNATERDRLNFRNPPDRTPELFERYLPYALALGVAQAWTEQFNNLLILNNYQPSWYTGTRAGPFDARIFSLVMAGSFQNTISSSTSAPGSSSGFGGGSSGGGGGGGGGGGW